MARLKIFDNPRFGLIVGLFLGAIVLFLIAGIVFMRTDQPKMRVAPRSSGMTILFSAPVSSARRITR